MIKKFILYSILICMALHCVSRIGLLNQLYQERFNIAFSIGLIDEVPIATCSSSYDFNQTLNIETKDAESSLPASISVAQEIQLFCSRELILIPTQSFLTLALLHPIKDEAIFYQYNSEVDHPPSI